MYTTVFVVPVPLGDGTENPAERIGPAAAPRRPRDRGARTADGRTEPAAAGRGILPTRWSAASAASGACTWTKAVGGAAATRRRRRACCPRRNNGHGGVQQPAISQSSARHVPVRSRAVPAVVVVFTPPLRNASNTV